MLKQKSDRRADGDHQQNTVEEAMYLYLSFTRGRRQTKRPRRMTVFSLSAFFLVVLSSLTLKTSDRYKCAHAFQQTAHTTSPFQRKPSFAVLRYPNPRSSSTTISESEVASQEREAVASFANNTLTDFDIESLSDGEDVPKPTANGGFSHTKASRAKISAANKGNTPWNKGKQRSEEVKARIAAGVRARNRQRFLDRLKDMGMTEEEYNQQKQEEERQKRADREARRTEKGGYRPTEETKQKISRILKEKYSDPEFCKQQQAKRRAASTILGPNGERIPKPVRSGFTHSEETKRKISEALRKRWANDDAYRQNMRIKCKAANSRPETKQRISQALRKRWQEPEFP